MIDVRCPLCKNRYSCGKMGMIPFENCGMFVIDDTIKRHKTNADRIRSMTDEELAELWWERVDCGECPVHRDCKMTGQDCKKLALDWLRQEVES